MCGCGANKTYCLLEVVWSSRFFGISGRCNAVILKHGRQAQPNRCTLPSSAPPSPPGCDFNVQLVRKDVH